MASSAEYWEKRMDEILAYVDRTDIDFFGELQSIYQDYYQKTVKELYAFYQRYATENNISLKEAKQRLLREDLSDYRANAEKYFKQAKDAKDGELLKRLNEQYSSAKVTRLEAVNLEIEWLMGRMNKELNQSFYNYLRDTAKHVFRKVKFGNSASTVSNHVLDQIVHMPWNGRNYSEQIWGNTDSLGKDIKDTFTKGFIKGSGPAEIARELRKKYNVTRAQAETLVQTDGTNVINNATAQRYRDAGLTKYQFWAHLDEATTKVCRDHHRKVYLLEDFQPGENAPPLHYRCRSTILPDDEEIGMEDDWQDEVAEKNQEYADNKRKKNQNKKDKNDYQKFKNVLKDSTPSFDEFVKTKYNDSEGWSDLKKMYQDAKWMQDYQKQTSTLQDEAKPFRNEPNSVVDVFKDGEHVERRYYGRTGVPRLDIDFTDHYTPTVHTNPHAHDWTYSDRNKKVPKHHGHRKLTEAEKIANKKRSE